MFTSFTTALSALNAHTAAVDVVGNNLANVNTPGYKASGVIFRDMVTALASGPGGTQTMLGAGQPLVSRHFTQGTIQPTAGLLDAAIRGDGFFVLRNREGMTAFTRDGSFRVDADGRLLTASGDRVQGWMEGTAATAMPGDIAVPVGALYPPAATTKFSLDLNLDAAAETDSAFSTPVEIFDSLGTSHILTATFTKTSPNAWDYKIEMPAADFTSAPAAPLSTGTLSFGADGRLSSSQAVPAVIDIAGLASGAADLKLAWNLVDDKGAARITQFGRASAVSATAQDGAAAASLTGVALEDGGKLVAQYSNGRTTEVAKLALASIRNPESLEGAGDNTFVAGAQTAAPAIGLPDSGGRGAVAAGAIEGSTVDIAREFTNLIVYQRGYQANSRVVTVSDELTQETINLKR